MIVKRILASFVLVAAMCVGVGVTQPVMADGICDDLDPNDELDKDLYEASGCGEDKTVGGVANNLIKIVLSLMGIIAVGVIIFGGITFMTSNGDASKVQKGRNILLYGIIGLIVALLAYVIVNFVTSIV